MAIGIEMSAVAIPPNAPAINPTIAPSAASIGAG
jgi:hypothetical protein